MGSGRIPQGDIGSLPPMPMETTITLTTDEWDMGSGDPTKDIIGRVDCTSKEQMTSFHNRQVTLLRWLVQQLSDKQPTIK
jgi:hypothetical protein